MNRNSRTTTNTTNSNKNNNSKNGQKEDLIFYKSKVKDMEGEISRLKQRLNDLRKAKNSVMIKREREIIHVGHPQVNREKNNQSAQAPPSSTAPPNGNTNADNGKYKELEERLKKSEKEKDDVNARIKELMDQRLLLNRDLLDERRKAEGFKEQLDNLVEKLELKSTQQENKHNENKHRESHITDLTHENAELRRKNEQLVEDLSVKEAKWVEKEEVFKQKELHLQKSWNEKYAKWMSDTEAKIEELKKQNMMLRDCLNRGVPREVKDESGASKKQQQKYKQEEKQDKKQVTAKPGFTKLFFNGPHF